MKNIFLKLFLILGLLCSVNVQADEIINYNASYDTLDMGLSIDQADFDTINTNHNQRLDPCDDGCERFNVDSQESRYSEPIGIDIQIISHTHTKEIGVSNFITSTKRTGDFSRLPLRPAGGYDTYIRDHNYNANRVQYHTTRDPDRDKEKQNQLVDIGQMAGYRSIGIQGDGYCLKTH